MKHGAIFVPAALVAAWLGAAGDVAAVEEPPGSRIEVRAKDMPAPYATPSVSNPPRLHQTLAGSNLLLPKGFVGEVFADQITQVRWLAVAPNGDVFATQLRSGKIWLLRDDNADGQAEAPNVFVDGFDQPHGLAVRPGFLYVADVRGIWRVPYEPGDTEAQGKPQRVTPEGAIGAGGGHWTRNIAFSPDGQRIYVTVGSRANVEEEPTPRATVQEFAADGSGQRTFAAGLRNPVGIGFYPGTNDLYVVVNERDGLGDGLVPDYLTKVQRDGFYGWPYSYIGPHPQPKLADKRPDLVKKAIVPDMLFRSHSAPLGLVFYDGDQFPAEYKGDAFVALHGSWNSAQPQGYAVVRVPFKDKKPADYYEIFASGFWLGGKDPAVVRGRPAGLAVAKDGSLLIADDYASVIWRVRYAP